MTDISSPKSFADEILPLPAHQLPFGANCALDRRVQSAAFHYGLSQVNVDMLVDLLLTKPISFSTCDPDGNADQVDTFALIIAYFPSPVTRSLVTQLVRRFCCVDPFAAIVKPDARKAPASGGSVKKKSKVSAVSGLVAVNVVPSTSAAAGAAALSPDAGASKPAKKSAEVSSGLSCDSDSDSKSKQRRPGRTSLPRPTKRRRTLIQWWRNWIRR